MYLPLLSCGYFATTQFNYQINHCDDALSPQIVCPVSSSTSRIFLNRLSIPSKSFFQKEWLSKRIPVGFHYCLYHYCTCNSCNGDQHFRKAFSTEFALIATQIFCFRPPTWRLWRNVKTAYRWFSRYAMLVEQNKRFLISSFCSSTSNCTLQHCYLCPSRLVANHLFSTKKNCSYFEPNYREKSP